MDQNAELLNYIHQNAQMGVVTTGQLKEIADDKKFLDLINRQNEEYKNLNREAEHLINKHNYQEKDLNSMAKISVHMNISMKTLTNKSPEHIAEMMIQGSTMGVIEAKKNIKKYQNADPKAVNLAEKLLHTEESNIEHLKSFL